MTKRYTIIFNTTVVMLALISSFFFNATPVQALSCIRPAHIFVGAYEQGRYVDGFVIVQAGTGNWCDTRAMVSERTDILQRAFELASQSMKPEIFSGVYQLTTTCGTVSWEERCAKDSKLEQLPLSASDLSRYKSEWQQIEQEERDSVTIQKWSVLALIITVTAFAILWPWISLKLLPHLGKWQPWIITIAILLQAALALKLNGTFTWSYSLWRSTAFYSSIGLGFFALIEIGLVIFILVRNVHSKKGSD